MGKVTGFLEFKRAERKYAPVDERVKHWHEFVQALSEEETKSRPRAAWTAASPIVTPAAR